MTLRSALLDTTTVVRPVPASATAPTGRFAWLTPMVLWPLARRHVPRPAVRPQGGGTRRSDDEAMFAAIVYVLVSGVAWRSLPKTFGISWQTAHRRFTQWSEMGLWQRLHEVSEAPTVPPQVRRWASEIGVLAEERREPTA
ncbi:transposase [Streptomyces sp. NPDC012769]|uniref:transposase n=1 Tax=Streptomyces sp. NPDC012769 TaxID=3364848 RepID=UPI0036D08E62